MKPNFFAVVNPAAGGGRCGRLVALALDRLRAKGIALDIAETTSPGHASELTRRAYAEGYRRFMAVGGDGTAFEIVNGLFPASQSPPAPNEDCPTLAFLPLGTGNSFLRDFTERGSEQAIEALLANRIRSCDVMRLTHKGGALYYINLLTMGFGADVAEVTNRKFKRWGELGYLLGIFTCLAQLEPQSFPVRVDGEQQADRRGCLFLSFNNSKFTGGQMMIAPHAVTDDGLIEYVRWGAIGRLGLLRNLRTLYDGTHIEHPLASRRAARRIDFELDRPVNVMVDGESLTLECRSLEVLPGALRIMI